MKNGITVFLVVILCFFIMETATANAPLNFGQSKKIANHIFVDNPITLYCGCRYDPITKKIDLSSCGMQSASGIERAHRLEWEHMMPAENFGRQLTCWRKPICQNRAGKYKGRKCCNKSSSEFRHMEAELYNLWPSVGLVNGARFNYRYSEFSDATFNSSSFYGCSILIDKSLRKIEPRNEAKGIVARANLLMSEKYGIKLSASQRHLFEVWDKKYLPTAWEKKWASRVATVEGYANPFIDRHN